MKEVELDDITLIPRFESDDPFEKDVIKETQILTVEVVDANDAALEIGNDDINNEILEMNNALRAFNNALETLTVGFPQTEVNIEKAKKDAIECLNYFQKKNGIQKIVNRIDQLYDNKTKTDTFIKCVNYVTPYIFPTLKNELSQKEVKMTEEFLTNTYNFGKAINNFDEVLGKYESEFLKAQKNQNANKDANSPKEGPDDYLKILNTIKKLREDYKNRETNGLKMDDYTKQFDELLKLAVKYEADHRPVFRGHRSKESAQRYKIMQDLIEEGRTMGSVFTAEIRNIRKNCRKITGARLTELEIKNMDKPYLGDDFIQDKMKKSKEHDADKFYNQLMDGSENTVSELKTNAIKNTIVGNLKNAFKENPYINVDKYYANVMAERKDWLAKSQPVNGLKDLPYRDLDVKQHAQAYVIDKYIRFAAVNPEKQQDVLLMTKPGKIKAEVESIITNETFKELVALDPKHAFYDWMNVNKYYEAQKEGAKSTIDEMRAGKMQSLEKRNQNISKETVCEAVYDLMLLDKSFQKAFEKLGAAFALGAKNNDKIEHEMFNKIVNKIAKNVPKELVEKYEGKDVSKLPDMLKDIEKSGILDKMAKETKPLLDKEFKKEDYQNRFKNAVDYYNHKLGYESPDVTYQNEIDNINRRIDQENETLENAKKWNEGLYNDLYTYIDDKFGRDTVKAYVKIEKNAEALKQKKEELKPDDYNKYLVEKFGKENVDLYNKLKENKNFLKKEEHIKGSIAINDKDSKEATASLKELGKLKDDYNKKLNEFNKNNPTQKKSAKAPQRK